MATTAAGAVGNGAWRVWRWPVLVALTVILASSRSHVAAPDVPSADKYAHFFVYGLLGTLVYRALGTRKGAVWIALAAVSLFGVTDEWHQYFVPGRSCDVADWLADTSGAALAILLYANWTWYRGRLESPLRQNRRIENPAATANLPGT